jgi:hypothetical protein
VIVSLADVTRPASNPQRGLEVGAGRSSRRATAGTPERIVVVEASIHHFLDTAGWPEQRRNGQVAPATARPG